MSTTLAILAIGSNLGDRFGHLQQAVDWLAGQPGLDVLAASPVLETEPVGGPDQGRFLNAVLQVQTKLTPKALLATCQAAEGHGERVRVERWGPRTIDVDIVCFGDLRCVSTELTIPHPRAHERAFVLKPWALLDPEATLFVADGEQRHAVAQLAHAAPDAAGLREFSRVLQVPEC